MVYLSKKEIEELIKVLPKDNSKVSKIIKKMKAPQNKPVYIYDKKGINVILKKAFREKRKVKINYYSLSSDETTNRIIDIYQLFEDCIVAYCNLRKEERTFVIRRINKAALLEERYSIPKGWTPKSIILNS